MDPFRGWMDGWVDRFSCGPSLCTPFGVIRHVISLPEILAPLTTTATLAREANRDFVTHKLSMRCLTCIIKKEKAIESIW